MSVEWIQWSPAIANINRTATKARLVFSINFDFSFFTAARDIWFRFALYILPSKTLIWSLLHGGLVNEQYTASQSTLGAHLLVATFG
jgi:hypothetical protein